MKFETGNNIVCFAFIAQAITSPSLKLSIGNDRAVMQSSCPGAMTLYVHSKKSNAFLAEWIVASFAVRYKDKFAKNQLFSPIYSLNSLGLI